MSENFKIKLQSISCFIFDVDGVLTDGTLLVMPQELHRTMNIKDGYALKAAAAAGYKIYIISGGKSESVRKRLSDLGLTDIHLGIEDKKAKLRDLVERDQLHSSNVLYMGDDLPDYEVMQMCGLPCCPSDAVPEIKSISLYVSPLKGGNGCVRDIIEQVMRLHNKWPYSIHSISI